VAAALADSGWAAADTGWVAAVVAAGTVWVAVMAAAATVAAGGCRSQAGPTPAMPDGDVKKTSKSLVFIRIASLAPQTPFFRLDLS